MTRRARPVPSGTRGPERLTNGLALLALVAIGIVWPPPDVNDVRGSNATARRERGPQASGLQETWTRPELDVQRAAAATRPAATAERPTRRAAAGVQPCAPAPTMEHRAEASPATASLPRA